MGEGGAGGGDRLTKVRGTDGRDKQHVPTLYLVCL